MWADPDLSHLLHPNSHCRVSQGRCRGTQGCREASPGVPWNIPRGLSKLVTIERPYRAYHLCCCYQKWTLHDLMTIQRNHLICSLNKVSSFPLLSPLLVFLCFLSGRDQHGGLDFRTRDAPLVGIGAQRTSPASPPGYTLSLILSIFACLLWLTGSALIL